MRVSWTGSSAADGCTSASVPSRSSCSAGRSPHPRERGDEMTELREQVRDRYAAAARSVKDGMAADDWSEDAGCCDPAEGLGIQLYEAGERDGLPEDAVLASLGCGNPTAVAERREGETVLDLGSGGGIDVLLSARRVGPAGHVIGLD